MARKIVHSEQVYGVSRSQMWKMEEALKAKHPGATVTTRWNSRQGHYTITASIEAAATRIQLRGVCQYCGRHQAVDGDTIVLHGYQRPGHGYTVGRCLGAKHTSLNKSDKLTRQWLAETTIAKNKFAIESEQTQKAARAAGIVFNNAEEHGAGYAKPRESWRSWQKPTEQQLAEFEAAMKAWETKFPKYSQWQRLEARASELRSAYNNEHMMEQHLTALLAAGHQGTPYMEVEK